MIIYIAGPMTGLPEFNFPAFDNAERMLVQVGYTVLNPARHGSGNATKQWIDYLIPCLYDVMSADGLALLPGWQASKGAQVEFTLATVHGKRTDPLQCWLDIAK